MKFIDAYKLLEVIAEQERWNVPDFVYKSIKEAPTIDAVEVVRCKDCKYSKYKQGELRCYIWSISSKTQEDGYCYCGARLEGAEE